MKDVIVRNGGRPERLLVICDHASDKLPPDIDLGLRGADRAAVLDAHVAIDHGALDVAGAVSAELDAPLIAGAWSRLVVDLNRPLDDPMAIPRESDGHAIPANASLSEAGFARRRAFHDTYHDAITAQLDRVPPALILSVHSFTPALSTKGEARPWHCGLLYNEDDRAARIAIDWLREDGLTVGDNEPYSGVRFGYTMNRHAEPRGIPYLFLEIRSDVIDDGWAARTATLVQHTLARLDVTA